MWYKSSIVYPKVPLSVTFLCKKSLPQVVTLSEAKGLSRWAGRMLRCAQHDNDALGIIVLAHMRVPQVVTLSASEGSVALGRQDASLRSA